MHPEPPAHHARPYVPMDGVIIGIIHGQLNSSGAALLMRVLIIFHGRLPGGPYPVAGIAFRAFTNGLGLTAHHHEVFYASRRRDLLEQPAVSTPPTFPFDSASELRQLVRTIAPDIVLLEGTYELQAVACLDVPIALDLYAPRLLEAQWEGIDSADEIVDLIASLERADYFLVTSEAHRHFYLGAMALAGVDCREDRIALVPLSCLLESPPRKEAEAPLLVSGGVSWPWQDSSWALQQVVGRLEQAQSGALHLLRGAYPLSPTGAALPPLPVPDRPPVQVRGLLSHDTMISLISSAWAVVDVTAPNLEREMALAFRHVDALYCGAPLILGAHAPLAPLISAQEAGWVVPFGDKDALDQALEQVLHHPQERQRRSQNARTLADERFRADVTVTPLVERIQKPTRRRARETAPGILARQAARSDALRTDLEEVRRSLQAMTADRDKKNEELLAFRAESRRQQEALSTLALSLEAALYLTQREAHQSSETLEGAETRLMALHRELDTLRRDGQKKSRELEALQQAQAQLLSDIGALNRALELAEKQRDESLVQAASLRGQLETAREVLTASRLELAQQQGQLEKKRAEMEALWATRDRLRAEIADLQLELKRQGVAQGEVEAQWRQALEAVQDQLKVCSQHADRQAIALNAAQQALETSRQDVETLRSLEGEVARLHGVIAQKDQDIASLTLHGRLKQARLSALQLMSELRSRKSS